MTTTTQLPNGTMQSDRHSATGSLVERARAIGPRLAEHSARHDLDGTFVVEAYDALRDAGLLTAAVPVELGGGGATITELTALQRELAHHCGASALASSMHQHVVAFTAWRYRRGMPGAESGTAMLSTRRPCSGSSRTNIVDMTDPWRDWLANRLRPETR